MMENRIISSALLDEIIRILVDAKHPDRSFREISALITAIHKLPKDNADDTNIGNIEDR